MVVEGTATASQIRKLILETLPAAPRDFQFLLNGIIVSPHQEETIFCSSFLPVVTLRSSVALEKVEVHKGSIVAEVKKIEC